MSLSLDLKSLDHKSLSLRTNLQVLHVPVLGPQVLVQIVLFTICQEGRTIVPIVSNTSMSQCPSAKDIHWTSSFLQPPTDSRNKSYTANVCIWCPACPRLWTTSPCPCPCPCPRPCPRPWTTSPCSCPCPCPRTNLQVHVLVLVLGPQVLVLVPVLGPQVLVLVLVLEPEVKSLMTSPMEGIRTHSVSVRQEDNPN